MQWLIWKAEECNLLVIIITLLNSSNILALPHFFSLYIWLFEGRFLTVCFNFFFVHGGIDDYYLPSKCFVFSSKVSFKYKSELLYISNTSFLSFYLPIVLYFMLLVWNKWEKSINYRTSLRCVLIIVNKGFAIICPYSHSKVIRSKERREACQRTCNVDLVYEWVWSLLLQTRSSVVTFSSFKI